MGDGGLGLHRINILVLSNSSVQKWDKWDERHAWDRGQKADPEEIAVAQPFRQKSAGYSGEHSTQIHEPCSDSEVGCLEIRKTGPHQEGDKDRGPETACKLVKGMDEGHEEKVP